LIATPFPATQETPFFLPYPGVFARNWLVCEYVGPLVCFPPVPLSVHCSPLAFSQVPPNNPPLTSSLHTTGLPLPTGPPHVPPPKSPGITHVCLYRFPPLLSLGCQRTTSCHEHFDLLTPWSGCDCVFPPPDSLSLIPIRPFLCNSKLSRAVLKCRLVTPLLPLKLFFSGLYSFLLVSSNPPGLFRLWVVATAFIS